MTHYLDVQAPRGLASVDVAPLEQSFRIVNPTPHTVVAVVAVPMGIHELARTFTRVADSGVTGSSNSTGALSQTLTIPARKGIIYSLSSTFSDPTDAQSVDIDFASETAVLTVTVTTYNGVGLSPTQVTTFPLTTARLGDTDQLKFGDDQARRFDANAVALAFFGASTDARRQRMLDWMERGGRTLEDLFAVYDWAVVQGFTGR